MKLVAQRVVQTGTSPRRASGINARCYAHPGRVWLDEPPDDLGEGQLVNQIIEVGSGPRRVRSYLDVIAPDSTPNEHIVAAVQSGTALLADAGRPAPWRLNHGEITFEFAADAALAAHWQMEVRLLLGYAIAVRPATASPDGAGILTGNIFKH
jgi:hypothetical protein